MNNRIWLSSPHMSGDEQKYIKEAFESNYVAPLGNNVDEFEKTLAGFTGAGYVAALISGTSALHLALIVLGIKPGDEVIASSFTFSATVNPIVYQGALPVLVDSEAETWNICPKALEVAIKDRISKGKKPRAIIVVHLYGMPAKMNEIMDIAEYYEIPVIEDAAEALGSKFDGKSLGTIGIMGILSFNGNKIITTSGGGALISDRPEMIAYSRFLATQARDVAPYYQHSVIGYNYRMSNILAGIGRGQMEVLVQRISQHRANNNFYREHIDGIRGVSFQREPDYKYFSNYWLTAISVDPSVNHGLTGEDIREAFSKENIECRPLWKPMHLQPVFSHCPYYGEGTSEKLFKDGICLPSGSNLTGDDLERIISVWDSVMRK